jgi:hypothetical protein
MKGYAMQVRGKTHIIYLVIFLLSITLRLGLSLVNREANDDHMQVVNLILQSGKLPQEYDCWECFQPKLFHFTVAKVLQGSGLADADLNTKILVAQFINFLAGVITLAVVWKFIIEFPVNNERLRLVSFALVALNPKLIGISSQATNDAFAILFSTLALYSTYVFLGKQKVVTFILILLFALLGISSKTNTLMTASAILVALCLKTWVQVDHRTKVLGYTLTFLFSLLVLVIVNPLTQYISNYRDHGSPVALNIERAPFPLFFQETTAYRPGIVSIWDGLFTFKIFDLLKHPRIEYGFSNYPAHRTSLWTQLYAGSQSVHFDNWPISWSTSGESGFWLSRCIFILALFPTLLILIGTFIDLLNTLQSTIRRNLSTAQTNCFGLFGLVFVAYLTFVALYALEFRDLSVMKAIFIYPALVSFPFLFLRAGIAIYAKLSKWKTGIMNIFMSGIAALLLLYVVDISWLIFQIHLK